MNATGNTLTQQNDITPKENCPNLENRNTHFTDLNSERKH